MARETFPTGQLTLGGSVLVQADKVSVNTDNGLALKATLANPNGTPVVGMRTAEFTWTMLVDNNGPELAAVKAVSDGASLDLGFKFPGGFSVTGKATAASAKIGQSLGDACMVDVTAKGHILTTEGF